MKEVSHQHPAVRSALKRGLDILGACVGLILFSPVFLVVSTAILVTMGRPILFRQERPGLDERIFTLMKFRTMRMPKVGETWYDSDADRITRLGRFLRKTSLDEIPQFFNLLRGDISLVGPRPLLKEYLGVYTERQKRRHEVRPGITGWAQVNGRNNLKLSERRELDVWYVENWSIWLDIRILWMTFVQVFRGKNVVAAGHISRVDDQGFEAALRSRESDVPGRADTKED